MAFTKAPEYNTHQQDFIPIGGDPKQYPLVINAGVDHIFKNALVTKVEGSVSMVPIPPITPDLTTRTQFDSHYGSGYHSVRSAYTGSLSGAISPTYSGGTIIPLVVEDDLWYYTPGSGITLKAAAQYTDSTGSIGWTDYAVGSTRYLVSMEALASGTGVLRYYDTGMNLIATTAVTFDGTVLPDIVFLDGYIFAAGGLTRQRIYNTDIGTPTTVNTSVSFIDVESNGDPLVGLVKHHNHLVAFGTNTIEFFYNAGNEIGSPLQRQASYAVNLGGYFDSGSYTTKCTIADITYFAAGQNGNYAGIYKLEKFRVEKISPDWLDSVINRGNEGLNQEGRFAFPPHVRACRFGTKYGILVTCGPVNADNIRETYFYDTTTGVWSLMGNSQTFYDGFTDLSTFGTLFFKRNYLVGATNDSPIWNCADDFYNMLGEFENPPGYTEVTSSWKTPPLNMKAFNDKHFYSVEVIGSFPYNTVTLYVEEDQMRTDAVNTANLGSKTQTKKENHQNPLIWRNIGRFRSPRITVEITGTNSYRLDGISVKYNQGTK